MNQFYSIILVMKKIKIVCVVGATASGKTGLGVKLAKDFNGEIVSADSRQVYIGMDIGTGKEGERAVIKLDSLGNQPARLIDSIPQYAVDIVKPTIRYSVAEWRNLADKLIANVVSRGKQPMVVGGTHLWINTLIENYTLASSNDEELKLRDIFEEKSLNDLLGMLKEKDMVTYKTIDHNNKRRIIRALTATLSNGVPFSRQKKKNNTMYNPFCLAIDTPREELYKKIDIRVDERIKIGMIEEVEDLLKKGVPKERLISFGLEYKFITLFLCGEMGREEMIQKLKYAIHGYARRQLTWMRNQMDITWVKSYGEAREKVEEFLHN